MQKEQTITDQTLIRKSIKITGLVQGVGFRPTVYKYATEFALTGMVNNTASGVFIEVEGENKYIDSFVTKLKKYPPKEAHIEEFTIEDIPIKNDLTFKIIESSKGKNNSNGKQGQNKTAEISPDLKVCDDCLREIFDIHNRRYLYPFTNCTNCGPRFSIIIDRPYDRELTSMSHFKMCPECLKEYNDPLDRRFHAQPNACPNCGPRLSILSTQSTQSSHPLEITIDALKKGMIVAIKSIGGFNLAVDPFNSSSVSKLRSLKKRQHRSFALMVKDLQVAQKYCHVSKAEIEQLTSSAAPIVLLKKKNPSSLSEINNELNNISPDNNYLGIMLPYTPLHHILFSLGNFESLIMTSANKYNEPIAIDDSSISLLFECGLADLALTNNREIIHRSDDSIVQISNIDDKLMTIRRSRGYVPSPFKVKSLENKCSLSLGSQLKNTFSYRSENKIYISQHIGDLEDARNLWYQQKEIEELKKLLDIDIDINCCKNNTDFHPGFSNFNEHENENHIYHHHAHLLSVIGEHNLFPPNQSQIQSVIGIIADGTGLGDDNKIWGFEFLKIKNTNTNEISLFERLAHLRYFPLIGGESAIHEIDRIAISLLTSAGIVDSSSWPKHLSLNSERIQLIKKLMLSNLNSPLTSSLGRLFDGIYALLYPLRKIEYEAQAAILLQREAELFMLDKNVNVDVDVDDVCEHHYPTKIVEVVNIDTKKYLIDFEPLMVNIINDLKGGVSTREIAYKFHLWVVNSIFDVLAIIDPENTSIKAFSGGCFQNLLLTNILQRSFEKKKIKYYRNQRVPINDAGISFGQALIL
ncbi:MAG: carbamoyltransferase HypF [Oligoflexia bacterium]|nr:carbamoyltransferase HypF [Oligoflexia bacterium]